MIDHSFVVERSMDDYIKRIDMLEELDRLQSVYVDALDKADVTMAVLRVRASDAVPVVRCGECKHWFENGTDLCSCDRDALLRSRDFFCADGERKYGDGNGSN